MAEPTKKEEEGKYHTSNVAGDLAQADLPPTKESASAEAVSIQDKIKGLAGILGFGAELFTPDMLRNLPLLLETLQQKVAESPPAVITDAMRKGLLGKPSETEETPQEKYRRQNIMGDLAQEAQEEKGKYHTSNVAGDLAQEEKEKYRTSNIMGDLAQDPKFQEFKQEQGQGLTDEEALKLLQKPTLEQHKKSGIDAAKKELDEPKEKGE